MSIILLPLGLLFLGWITTAIVLSLNRKTRTIGIVVLAVPAILLVVAVVLPILFSFMPATAATSHQSPQQVIRIDEQKKPVVEKDAGQPSDSPKNRPAWVDAKPGLVGDVYQMSIMVGPFTTRLECDAKLPEALQEALNRYVELCLATPTSDRVELPADYLRKHLIKGQWEQVREHSVGPMIQLHVLLQFDREVKDRILEEHTRQIVAQRLWVAGIGLTAILAFLAVLYGYLKIDRNRSQPSA